MKFNKWILGLAAIGAVALMSAGCASNPNLKNPPPSHIVHVIGSGKQLGINAAQTGSASLGYQSIMSDVMTVPCQLVTNSTGDQKFVTPEIVISYEIKGSQNNPLIGGAAGSTLTIAIGGTGVQTWLGGQHLPINNETNQPTPPLIQLPAK